MIQMDFGRDRQLTARMIITLLLLGALYGVAIAILVSLGTNIIVVLVIAVVLVLFQFWFSDRMVLMSMRAKLVSPQEAPQLHAMVERLATAAGVRKPKIAISKLDVPNAFASGRTTSSATVAVTNGLLNLLSDREMEAVLAHEMTHIKNRDVVVMTIASFFLVVASTLMNFFMFMGIFGGFGGRGRQGGGAPIMIALLVTIAVLIIGKLLVSALSRYREFAADRGAAIITGAPQDLISALTRINGSVQRIPKQDLRKAESMNAFFILPAVGGSFASLFSTHPSLAKRIERLQAIQGALGF